MKYRYKIALAIGCLVPTIVKSMEVDSVRVVELIQNGDKTALSDYLKGKDISVSDRDYWKEIAETRRDLAAIRCGLKTRGQIEGFGALATGSATGYGTCKLLPSDELKDNPTKSMGAKYGASAGTFIAGSAITIGLALSARDNYNAGSEAQAELNEWAAIVDYLQGRNDAIPQNDVQLLETVKELQEALDALG